MRRWLFSTLACLLLFAGSLAPAFAPAQPAAEEAFSTPPPAPPPIAGEIDRTGYIKGLYISYPALGHADFVSHVQALLEETELNAVVMDFKGDYGLLTFPTQVSLARQIGAAQAPVVQDPQAFLAWFKERRVYTIARIVVFKDDRLANAAPALAVRDVATGGVWHDQEGMGWVDPYRQEAWTYNADLAAEAAALGFDEVQLDYVRFPTDGNMDRASFSQPSTYHGRVAAITGLMRTVRQVLAPQGVKLGADVFGYTAWTPDDLGIGQHIESLAPHLDVLAPMVYPSTFNAGLPGEDPRYRNAIAFPYEIVRKSTERTVDRALSTNPSIVVRPWIQDFGDYAFDYRTYTPSEIRLQMDGVRAGGGRGWMLWDPAVRYTRGALVSAQPAHLPNPAGSVPVLVYRDFIGPSAAAVPGTSGRTIEAFRNDLQRLIEAGFYPVNLGDLAQEHLRAVPAGKRPIVLTFDGSAASQFRWLPDGQVDPDCAVGVLLAFNATHGVDWPLRATFFVQQEVGRPGDGLFGASDLAPQKLKQLVAWGMEVGVLPIGGSALNTLSDAAVQEALGIASQQLTNWLGGYTANSLALPDGALPTTTALLKAGSHNGVAYTYTAAVLPNGGLAPSPSHAAFAPLRIPRVQGDDASLNRLLAQGARRGVFYVSGGE